MSTTMAHAVYATYVFASQSFFEQRGPVVYADQYGGSGANIDTRINEALHFSGFGLHALSA